MTTYPSTNLSFDTADRAQNSNATRYSSYPKVPVYRFLFDNAAKYPARPALLFFGHAVSYGLLAEQVQRVASGLVSAGMHRGDRVVVILPNSPEAVVAYHAILWAGGVAVMLNPLYTKHELRMLLQDSGARFAFTLRQSVSTVVEATRETGVESLFVTGLEDWLPLPLSVLYRVKTRWSENAVHPPEGLQLHRYRDLLEHEPMADPEPVDPTRDLALLQYTGGTTGSPKGAELTHFNLVANCLQVHARLPRLDEEQVTMIGVLPLFHAYGLTTVMNYGMMIGARIVLLPRFVVRDVLNAIERFRPEMFPGVPAMYTAINEVSGHRCIDLSTIRFCVCGAAPMPPHAKEAFEKLTGAKLIEGYGLTEASPATHVNPFDGSEKPGAVGLPLRDTTCRVVDLQSGADVAPGQSGELLIRGPQVMRGYWNRPEETSATLASGWLHTGDIALVDEDGFFYIVDRKKELILVSGFNVYPSEVEAALLGHESVEEAAVIGVPDSHSGEAVKAFVVRRKGESCSEEELIRWCRQHLAGYKTPKWIEFRSELPKSLIGKVLRRVLAEQEARSNRSGAEA